MRARPLSHAPCTLLAATQKIFRVASFKEHTCGVEISGQTKKPNSEKTYDPHALTTAMLAPALTTAARDKLTANQASATLKPFLVRWDPLSTSSLLLCEIFEHPRRDRTVTASTEAAAEDAIR